VGLVKDTAAVIATHEPVCSICIANYNGEAVIGPCLESIYDQDFHLPFEIILHDDASTDDSVDFIKTRYPNVVLIVSESNAGYCISNNRMVSRARGRYILLLNNDAVLHRDAIRTLYKYAERQPGPAILGLPQYDMQTGELIDRGSLFDPFLNPVPNGDPGRTDVGMVMGACYWIPKGLWDELGGFPEWFGSLAEDMYLCCLARLKGCPVTVMPESGFDHWVGRSFRGGKVVQNALRTSYQRRALSERNKTITMLLCYPSCAATLLIPLHFLALAGEGLILSFLKRRARVFNDIYWFSFKSVYEEKGRIWRLRRKIQSTRRISCRRFFSVHKPMPHKLNMLFRYGLPGIE
jgi:GT2 family glycosyltransferase